jgi:hypothetical protein
MVDPELRKAQSRASYQRHKKERQAKAREYARLHPEKIKANIDKRRQQLAASEELRTAKKAYMKAWYEAHRDDEIAKAQARQAANPPDTSNWKEWKTNHANKYPERPPAWYKVKRAMLDGTLPHPSSLDCVACGSPAEHYHHHNGYLPPHELDVIALCRDCHVKADRQLRQTR